MVRDKTVTFEKFLEDNHKALTVFGVFVALTAYLINLFGANPDTDLNNYIILISFSIALLTGVNIFRKYIYEDDIELDSFVQIFIILFFLLLASLTVYLKDIYKENLKVVMSLLSLLIGFYIPFKFLASADIFFKKKLKDIKYLIFFIIVSCILFNISSNEYGTFISKVSIFVSDYFLFSSNYVFPFMMGVFMGLAAVYFKIFLLSIDAFIYNIKKLYQFLLKK